MKNIAPIGRFGLSMLVVAAEFFAIVQFQLFDGLIKSLPLVAYFVNAAVAAFAAGIAYGLLPGKRAIDETKRSLNYTTESQPGASSERSRAYGYWIWLGIFVVLLTGILYWYSQEI